MLLMLNCYFFNTTVYVYMCIYRNFFTFQDCISFLGLKVTISNSLIFPGFHEFVNVK